jgi:hypothetical protein
MASFTHMENFGVHAPRLIRIDGHDPVRVSLEAPLKYGPELQLGIMQLEREGSPPPGLRLPQAKLSRKSNQVARGRIRRFESYMPSQPVRSLWAASLALSDSDQQPRQIGGMSVGGASYSSGVVRLSRPLPDVRAARRAPGSSPPPCW